MTPDEYWNCVDATTKRRLFLCERSPSCPRCNTRQVQLVGYIGVDPAQWKCRECKHQFAYEPEAKQ